MITYEPIQVPQGFITTLSKEVVLNRNSVSRALSGFFSPYGRNVEGFLSIRAKACEMLGRENTDVREK